MAKVSQGASLGDSPLRSAGFINSVVDSVEDYKGRAAGNDRDSKFTTHSLCTVQVKNLTGDDRRRGDCMQVGDILLDELDPQHLWFEGNTVAEPVGLKFVILREPIPADKIGTAQASGVCLAWVNVTDADHTHAIPVDGQAALDSANDGPFELLQAPDGDGEQELCVRFVWSDHARCAVLDEELAPGGHAMATIRTRAAGEDHDDDALEETDEQVKVFDHLLGNDADPLEIDIPIFIARHSDGRWYVSGAGCFPIERSSGG